MCVCTPHNLVDATLAVSVVGILRCEWGHDDYRYVVGFPVGGSSCKICTDCGFVNSKHGTQFRQWATRVLREHLVRGCTVNVTQGRF